MRYLIPIVLVAMAAGGCTSWQRVGQLTMLSTRNVDSGKPYTLLLRGVEADAKMRKDDALQAAVDEAVAQHPGGEYMMNVQVLVQSNGKRVKVQGDVWGLPNEAGTAPASATGTASMAVGNRVAFKLAGKLTEGTIVGMRTTTALVEYDGSAGKKMKEVELTKLTLLR